MKILLDSCVFLWLIDQHKNIPNKVKEQIINPLNDVYLSSISITEITIKTQLGKLSIPEPYAEFLITQRRKHGISSLSLNEEDLLVLEKLPDIHSDPFDRLLICQAIQNKMSFATPDKKIHQYPINLIW